MIVLNNNFEVVEIYNKNKLVPFGEFLPFENILNTFGLKKITEGHGSFIKGEKRNNLMVKNFQILPLICYELIFTDFIQQSKNHKSITRAGKKIMDKVV